MTLFSKVALLSMAALFFSMNPAAADELRLKNGDRISGTLVAMEEGKLIFKTSYAGEVSITWEEISTMSTEAPIRVVLSDETALNGITQSAEAGKMKMRMGKIVETVSFDLKEVRAINPKPAATEPAVKTKGHVNIGITSTKGNSETGTQHFDGEFVARTEKNRFTIGGEFNRAEDDGAKTVNNAFGSLKYDHFLTRQWYLYSSASFEKDEFKDLDLRTTLGLGAGYQFMETPVTNLSLEAGLTYVNEDYDTGQDDGFPSARWSLNFDRYFVKKVIQFFHFHEGFVSLDDTNDMIIRSRTGLRFPLYKNLAATAQYNLDWDKSPESDREKTDHMYVLTLGYQW